VKKRHEAAHPTNSRLLYSPQSQPLPSSQAVCGGRSSTPGLELHHTKLLLMPISTFLRDWHLSCLQQCRCAESRRTPVGVPLVDALRILGRWLRILWLRACTHIHNIHTLNSIHGTPTQHVATSQHSIHHHGQLAALGGVLCGSPSSPIFGPPASPASFSPSFSPSPVFVGDLSVLSGIQAKRIARRERQAPITTPSLHTQVCKDTQHPIQHGPDAARTHGFGTHPPSAPSCSTQCCPSGC
jgi:hypothetical protein